MKILLAFPLALVLAAPVAATGVYEAHDKFPQRHAVTAEDNECTEHHHLTPDGDHDCDDVKRGVPEPDGWGPTALLGLGIAGVYLSARRRRG